MKKHILGILLFAANAATYAVPVLNQEDFITNGAQTNFNGFENIPVAASHYSGGSEPYTEDGITVRQINGDPGNDILAAGWNINGNYSWFPDAGDHGYTAITLANGLDFSAVSLQFRADRTFHGHITGIQYNLLKDGVSVLSGLMRTSNGDVRRIGFENGGFDEIWLRGGIWGVFGDNRLQGLQIDSIKAIQAQNNVPEPGTLLLLGLGALGMTRLRRRM